MVELDDSDAVADSVSEILEEAVGLTGLEKVGESVADEERVEECVGVTDIEEVPLADAVSEVVALEVLVGDEVPDVDSEVTPPPDH